MSMTEHLQRAGNYFMQYFGVTLDALLHPIDPSMPTGKSVRNNGVYNTIEQARLHDDASLPMGGWEHDLKRADWDKVSAVAVDALLHKSKDLQLVGWLLEAQINKTGFAGIAPCMLLMQTLCERYWTELYPQVEDGDLEYRANIIRWANEKLLPALRLVPITASNRDYDYSWASWEQARRNEQIRSAASSNTALEGATLNELNHAMTNSTTAHFLQLHNTLGEALDSIAMLDDTLEMQFGRDAPSLTAMAGLLSQIQSLLESELHKRGVRAGPEHLPMEPTATLPANPGAEQFMQPNSLAEGQLRDRADAYAQLAAAADFLMQIEPHSPVPYLVKRATEWGRMNTVELYHELFLKLGGQLNIFEMLGLDQNEQKQE